MASKFGLEKGALTAGNVTMFLGVCFITDYEMNDSCDNQHE